MSAGHLIGKRGSRFYSTASYRPPGTGAAICRGCQLIFRPKLAHHVVCPRCHRYARRARGVMT